jgi:hypothetical protein
MSWGGEEQRARGSGEQAPSAALSKPGMKTTGVSALGGEAINLLTNKVRAR